MGSKNIFGMWVSSDYVSQTIHVIVNDCRIRKFNRGLVWIMWSDQIIGKKNLGAADYYVKLFIQMYLE